MKKMKVPALALVLLYSSILSSLISIIPSTASAAAPNPVSYYGEMKANGNRIHGSKTNAPMQVKGASFFWSNWSGSFWNAGMVNRMVDEFKSEIVRATYGVDDRGTPYNTADEAKVREVVDAAINKGVYVIIDWHTHGAEYNVNAAKDFFSRMARQYGSYDNVIFEIFNEPLQVPWSTVKGYAEQVIPVIREHSDNLIVVGTPTWSQDVDNASFDKINADNIAYALHFYIGTHGQGLVNKLNTALNNGAAIFATEWGFWNQNTDPMTADQWMNVLDQNQISWANWAVNDKDEPASFFRADGGLTPAGQYFKDQLAKHALTAEWRRDTVIHSIPGKIEAEAYSASNGITIEESTEGGSNVGYIDNGDWLDYQVNAAAAGSYKVSFRVASLTGAANAFQLKNGASTLATVSVPNTGGWQAWTTVTADVNLNAGPQTLRISAMNGGWNVNAMQFTGNSGNPPTPVNVALNKPATASSAESAANGAGNAFDGKAATRWSSSFADPQWISVDLGAVYDISHVKLNWEAAYASSYKIQVSSNGTAWNDVYSTTTGNGGIDDLTVAGTGRYVRMHATARGTPYGNSLFEFEVYGTPSGSIDPAPVVNLLTNGSFANGMTDWDFNVNTANASVAVTNGEAAIAVTTPGVQTYMPQLVQDGFAITNGQLYKLTFEARASVVRPMEVSINSGPADYATIWNHTVNLTGSKQTYTYTFTANMTDSNARLDFNMGGQSGNVIIDNVVLSRVGEGPNGPTASPVSYFGEMTVSGNRINGSKTGAPMQVKGMSFFWSNWSGQYWNAATVDRMVDELKVEIVRASYGVADDGTPHNPADEAIVRDVVNAAIDRGVYVIIDWHTHGAQYNIGAAKAFFAKMAQEYGGHDNVIFEIYNEPLQIPWSTIKSYAEEVIPVIRQHSNNLIVVGTPSWSQEVDQASFNPITSASNIAYTLHFYAGTHMQYLRDKGNTAMNNGLALLATEWGSCNADGNGGINYASTSEWLQWMDQNQVSWANWAINDKAETSSIFRPDGSLTEAGNYLKDILTTHAQTAEWRQVH
ncbi:cellulase family glycosylhydrolase [Paenibacillus sp. NPDC058174]|uniref:cellulase family glycosylhydrolase n=1 Tax=Paenibacillus sp. NPDC058174 TaxID=3346366 RepID=UPI0036DD7B0F